MQWFALTLTPFDESLCGESLDEICSELMERGALGTSIDNAPQITCYIQGDSEAAQKIAASLPDLKCQLLSLNEVSETNWTGACPDVWEPIKIGALEIVPVESTSDHRPIPEGALRLIPGLGFGTGHHPTTRMVLAELSALVEREGSRRYSVLDLGTGSGILAIAAAHLLNTPVEAIDIEEGAIENARDNVLINTLSHLIQPSTTPIERLRGSYDLILANLYGEVLCQLAAEVARVARPGAVAIMSGITELVWDQVLDAYTANNTWHLESERSDNGWVCAVFKRRAPS